MTVYQKLSGQGMVDEKIIGNLWKSLGVTPN
jgi:hypothetical protein